MNQRKYNFTALKYIAIFFYVAGFFVGIFLPLHSPGTNKIIPHVVEESNTNFLVRMNYSKPSLLPKQPDVIKLSITGMFKQSNVQGGVVMKKICATHVPNLFFNNKQIAIEKVNGDWIAFIGIPYTTKSGKYYLSDALGVKHYPFVVKYKQYGVQRLRISNKRKVNPPESDWKRIKRERTEILDALAIFNLGVQKFPFPLLKPVSGRHSGKYGVRRFINGKKKNPHKGLDIAAVKGTPVLASADGTVVVAGNFFYTGNTVIVSHGFGVNTLYGHLNVINVIKGQEVIRGQNIGTVGRTGRATGPHLHWAVSMNDTLIDPILVMDGVK